jgi:hypothetical protein
VGHVERNDEKRNALAYRFLRRNLKERDILKDNGIDGKVKVGWILKKYSREFEMESTDTTEASEGLLLAQ